MLEHARGFHPNLTIIADKLDPLADASGKDTGSVPGASEQGDKV